MTLPIPTLDDLDPSWRTLLATLQAAEAATACTAKGTPERRALSRETSALARRWRKLKDDLVQARLEAGWARSSPISWVRRLDAPDAREG